jgi:hypothetical protein
MRAHQWFVEHREDFVIGVLERREREAFRDHLRRCPECREAVEAADHDLRWLPLGAAPVPVPPGMVRRLATGVLERPARRRRWLVPAALAAAALAAIGLATRERRATRDLEVELARLRAALAAQDAALAAAIDTLRSIRMANRVLQTELGVAGRRARVVVFETDRTRQWTVMVTGLPPAPTGQRYAIWFVCERGMRQGAALPRADGTIVLVVSKPTDLGAVLAASVTLESVAMSNGMPVTKLELGVLKL